MIWIIFIVTMGASWLIGNRLKSKFRRYSQIGLRSNLSGKEIAERMLQDYGIYDVQVISTPGQLTDHYNPANKTVNLSDGVYHGRSAAAAAVAAHECGHAVQHATAYSMLQFRSAMVPLQLVSNRILSFLFIAGLFGSFAFNILPLNLVMLIVVGAYGVITTFSFVTLPVEYDASKRALKWIDEKGIVTSQEYEMAKDALNTAALTYVVSALGSLATLLYYLSYFMGGDD